MYEPHETYRCGFEMSVNKMDGWCRDVLVIPTSLSLPLSLSPGKVFRLWRPTSMPFRQQTSKKAANLQTNFYNVRIEGTNTLLRLCAVFQVSLMLSHLLCSREALSLDFCSLSNVCYCRSKNSFQQTCDPTVNTGNESNAGGSQCQAVSSNVFGSWRSANTNTTTFVPLLFASELGVILTHIYRFVLMFFTQFEGCKSSCWNSTLFNLFSLRLNPVKILSSTLNPEFSCL